MDFIKGNKTYKKKQHADKRFARSLIERSRRSSSEALGCILTDYRLYREVKWMIEHFCELPPVELFCPVSSVFTFEGQDWKLQIWPNYDPETIELNLLRKGPCVVNRNQVVTFCFGLGRSDGTIESIESKEFNMGLQCQEWSCAVTSRALQRSLLLKERETLLRGGRLTINCQLSVATASSTRNASTQTVEDGDDRMSKESILGRNIEDKGRQSADPKVLATLGQNLKDLYTAGKDSDVTIKVKDKTFAAHRIILGARTPVLAAMFSHNMAEAETGVVSVEDCDPEAFAAFLLFVYSGTTEDVSTENVMSVYYIADKYDLPELKEECVWFMLSNLNVDNICSVIDVASRHGERSLLEMATEFFHDNAKEIFVTSQWEKFMAENTSQARELIIGYAKRK